MTIKRNGIREWIFQRISNLVIFLYALFYIYSILSFEELNYQDWSAMHSALWFKIVSTITFFIVALNSILAGWQIGTDYTQKVPIPGFSVFFHSFYVVLSLVFLAFALFILWR